MRRQMLLRVAALPAFLAACVALERPPVERVVVESDEFWPWTVHPRPCAK